MAHVIESLDIRTAAPPARVDVAGGHPLLHPASAVGFDQPFEMLGACHERVQRMLRLLLRLGAHLAEHGADDRAADAARDVMRYFDLAGPAHHEDEERHVIPWLAAHGRTELAERLRADHRLMTEAWSRVRCDLEDVVCGAWQRADAPQQRSRWEVFAALYTVHMGLEESLAFPPVRMASSADALRHMGAEMAARRGAAPPS